MRKLILQSLLTLTIFTFVTGVLYPLGITFIAQSFLKEKANGSMIAVNGKDIGSELLAQNFKKEIYFWPRPSSADFATVPSGASNFGPTSQKLKERVQASMKQLGVGPHDPAMPYDMLLTSASGLDPHITPTSASFQIKRVAAARKIDPAKLQDLVDKMTEDSLLGFMGRPRVNVLKLNLALDALQK